MNLTPTQNIAVQTMDQNILVSAGAGTGKTRVLVERFLYLIQSNRALVNEILTLTFTEKAALEMKSRIQAGLKRLGLESARRQLEYAYISTIHAFASRILKQHPIEAAIDPDFRVLEAEEADLFKEQALDEAIEKACCEKESPAFQLLKIYGERTVRTGFLKLLDASRTEGKYLHEFIAETGDRLKQITANLSPVSVLLNHVQEKELLQDWKRFKERTSWDWQVVEDFKKWSGSFSRRGGKNDRADWKKIAASCDEFLAGRLDLFAVPWRVPVEGLALLFEDVYEARKRVEAFLDFDDLQMKVIRLFRDPRVSHQKIREHYRRHFKFILVDEFQDTNLLQTQLVEMLSSGSNLFFVGDFKQSIYGFRGTTPIHFLETQDRYRSRGEGIQISLVENFRTEGPLVQFINQFFDELWKEDGLPFEPLAAKVDTAGEGVPVELHLTQLEEGESLERGRMREAARMAGRIRKFVEAGTSYGDIAILFQAMTSSGIYEQALKKAGIPYFVVAGRGFYHQPEIRDMMSFLACLENPLSDIPLAATLRSPLFQISDDSLFRLARHAKEKDEMTPLYTGLKQLEKIAEIPEPEKKKLRFFQSTLDEFLAEKDKMRLVELLDRILQRTSYELTVLADPQGARKYANLRKLIDLAREYESHEIMPLGDFIRTIRGLENREIRESEAQVEIEGSGRAVRLMTIHAAKGLEFPIVFLADLAHQRRRLDSRTFLAEAGIGYSFLVRNDQTLSMEEPLSWKKICEAIETREAMEWKRLFYVGMTRAKKTLILSGVHKPKKETKESFHEMSSWTDWVVRLNEIVPKADEISIPGPYFFKEAEPELKKRIRKYLEGEEIREDYPPQVKEEADKILERLVSKERTPSRVIDLPVSAYVAFCKSPEEYYERYELGFPEMELELEAGERRLSPEEETDDLISKVDLGTAVHRVLEYLDYKNPSRSLEELLKKNRFRPLSEKIRRAVQGFIQNPFFQRLVRSKGAYRELPFLLNERHGVVYGVLDLLFEDAEGNWYVLDYKNAAGDRAKVEKSGYEWQVEIYLLAAGELLGKIPKAGFVHFLENQWTCEIAFDLKHQEAVRARLQKMQEEILEFSRRSEYHVTHVL